MTLADLKDGEPCVRRPDCPPTMHSVVRAWAEQTPHAAAIGAPGRAPLTYSALLAEIERAVAALKALGVSREDRVALVLPQGAEIAVALLAVSAVAIAAPLNPALTGDELAGAFETLAPALLVVPAGVDSRAAEVARGQGIRIVELVVRPDSPAGSFDLSGVGADAVDAPGLSGPEDIGLALPTTGTTGRSKFVLLRHRNFCAAAENTMAALQLTQADRCLDVMPSFHAHGLVAGVFASLRAGAQVVCTPAFDAARFFEWLAEFRPTWYTAVPTMHQTIVAEASVHRELIEACSLRFVRSASSILSQALLEDLERTFGAPVTESYGLTEASQLTNTPLDRRKQKPGSLGTTGSSQIAIMGPDGALLGQGVSGEIVCRGPVVMAGYLGDPEATKQCFVDGWFKTGDIGQLDPDGHLYMTGRLKEMINRGGEKVVPEEVDRVLLTYPPIAQAVTFGIPDPVMGEEIAAVVVIRPGMAATAAQVREFASGALSDHKVPRRVLIVPSIPAGPTGKLTRRKMGAYFGHLLSGPRRDGRVPVEARDALERGLAGIWKDVLRVESVGVTDDFFDCGGNSLLAVRMLEEVERFSGRVLHPSVLFSTPTIEGLARVLREDQAVIGPPSPIIEIRKGGGRPAFFFLDGTYNGGGYYCRDLGRSLAPDQPFYDMPTIGLDSSGAAGTIESRAEAHLATLLAKQPKGPYLLGGYSHAGLIAYEMARRLEARGERVPLLVVIDMPAPDPRLHWVRKAVRAVGTLRGLEQGRQDEAFLTWRWRFLQVSGAAKDGAHQAIVFALGRIAAMIRARVRSSGTAVPGEAALSNTEGTDAVSMAFRRMVDLYVPRRFQGHVTLFVSREGPITWVNDAMMGWQRLTPHVETVMVPGNHDSCVTTHAETLARHLQHFIDRASS